MESVQQPTYMPYDELMSMADQEMTEIRAMRIGLEPLTAADAIKIRERINSSPVKKPIIELKNYADEFTSIKRKEKGTRAFSVPGIGLAGFYGYDTLSSWLYDLGVSNIPPIVHTAPKYVRDILAFLGIGACAAVCLYAKYKGRQLLRDLSDRTMEDFALPDIGPEVGRIYSTYDKLESIMPRRPIYER